VNTQHASHQSSTNVVYCALAAQTRTTVGTEEAAFHLGRKAQTLRKWACYEDGPIRPVRICGRLAWSVADLKRVQLEGDAK
jgi:hypothetical protein